VILSPLPWFLAPLLVVSSSLIFPAAFCHHPGLSPFFSLSSSVSGGRNQWRKHVSTWGTISTEKTFNFMRLERRREGSRDTFQSYL
jgi:hypothetical protein